jgi:hypothetical protein
MLVVQAREEWELVGLRLLGRMDMGDREEVGTA